jgi:hypothetical protein
LLATEQIEKIESGRVILATKTEKKVVVTRLQPAWNPMMTKQISRPFKNQDSS